MRLLYQLRETVKFKVFRPLLLSTGKWMAKYASVGNVPVFDNASFEWAGMLESNWKGIRNELETILLHHDQLPSLQDIQQEQQVLNQDNKWKTWFLYGFGQKATLNCQACPFTTSVLEKIPGMKTAFFSVLSPHKHIPAHTGLFKGLIRSHLGLIIPGKAGECRMRITDRFINWEEGKVEVFDDTFDHEVWNDTNEVRVVLLLDVMRPFRSRFFTRMNEWVVRMIGQSSYVKEAQQNHLQWETRFHQPAPIPGSLLN